MTAKLTTIAFDADDTLWHNEEIFRLTQDRFASLLSDYVEGEHLAERLLAAERRNLGHYGYGVKGFVLTMIETAIEVSEHKVPPSVIAEIMEAGRAMLDHPIKLLADVEKTVTDLAPDYQILLITKGDLLDQERKLAQSGLGDLFDGVEIVSEKTPQAYHRIFNRYATAPQSAMMVGNSLRSDVNPAIEVGAWGIHIPHDLTWELEHADAPVNHPRFHQLDRMGSLSGLIDDIQKN